MNYFADELTALSNYYGVDKSPSNTRLHLGLGWLFREDYMHRAQRPTKPYTENGANRLTN